MGDRKEEKKGVVEKKANKFGDWLASDEFAKILKEEFDAVAKDGKLNSNTDFENAFKKVLAAVLPKAKQLGPSGFGEKFQKDAEKMIGEMEADTSANATDFDEFSLNVKTMFFSFTED